MLELAPLPSQQMITTTFANLLGPLIPIFSSTLASLSALIKRSLNKYTLLALSAFSSLDELSTQWNEIMCKLAGRKENELKDGMHALRASCLRSFPEFLADVRMNAMSKGGELSTGLADFSISVSSFVIYLHSFSYRSSDGILYRALARGPRWCRSCTHDPW